MGRASSSKKVARAAKAAGRPGTKKSLVWPVSIGLVVLLGVGLIAISAAGRESGADVQPLLGDHWHAAYGLYACDEFLPAVNDAVADQSGIHSHGDGLIHMHPLSTKYTGEGASLAAFGETTDLEISDDAIAMPSGDTYENGDDCGGEPGQVQVKVWSGPGGTEGRMLDGGFADFAPQDGDILTVAFAPEGAEIPPPPSAGTQPSDVVPAPGDTVPQGVPSTLPTDEGATSGEPAEGETGGEPADGATSTEGGTTDTSAVEGGDTSSTSTP